MQDRMALLQSREAQRAFRLCETENVLVPSNPLVLGEQKRLQRSVVPLPCLGAFLLARLGKNLESLTRSSLTQILVEAHELETRRGLVSPDEGCGKLERIRGSQGVRPKKPLRTLSDELGWLNFGAFAEQSGQHLEALNLGFSGKRALAPPPGYGGDAFHGACPPNHDVLVGSGES